MSGLHTPECLALRDYTIMVIHAKPLTVWIMKNCGKLLKRWEYQTVLPVTWETRMQVKKQQLEPCMEQLTGSGFSKEYNKAVIVSLFI